MKIKSFAMIKCKLFGLKNTQTYTLQVEMSQIYFKVKGLLSFIYKKKRDKFSRSPSCYRLRISRSSVVQKRVGSAAVWTLRKRKCKAVKNRLRGKNSTCLTAIFHSIEHFSALYIESALSTHSIFSI